MPSAVPNSVSSALTGSSTTADSRVPSARSATTSAVRPSAAARLIRGISAVSSETPRTPYGTCSSSQALE